MTSSVAIAEHQPCPMCKSSDAYTLYSDGHGYCFSCRGFKKKDTEPMNQTVVLNRPRPKTNLPDMPESFSALEDRGINQKTAEKYKVSYIEDGPFVHHYPYTRKGEYVASKKRKRETKGFAWAGDTGNLDLFGQGSFPAGCAPAITIVEGECDALAAYQMNGGFPVVSVQSASTAERDVRSNFEYLSSFEEIVICFDSDEAGSEAAIKVANVLPVGKVRILSLSEHKDANDYLQYGKGRLFKQEWYNAAKYTPATLKTGKQLWDEIINVPDYETVSYPFEGIDKMTYGIRLSELVIVNAGHKVGKSTFLGEITHHILNHTESGIGLMRLEESNRDSALNLMSIEANKRLHLPDVWEQCTTEEIREYYDKVMNTDRIIIWDHFGSNSIEAVLNQIRNMAALGCKYIVLDHISIIVSDQSGDERKQLDELATKIKSLCMEINVCVLAVVHQNREGKIRGTAGIEQLANIVIRLERDKEHTSDFVRNSTKVVISDNRFCGVTGLACYLYFDQETGRMLEYTEEQFLESAASGTVEGW